MKFFIALVSLLLPIFITQTSLANTPGNSATPDNDGPVVAQMLTPNPQPGQPMPPPTEPRRSDRPVGPGHGPGSRGFDLPNPPDPDQGSNGNSNSNGDNNNSKPNPPSNAPDDRGGPSATNISSNNGNGNGNGNGPGAPPPRPLDKPNTNAEVPKNIGESGVLPEGPNQRAIVPSPGVSAPRHQPAPPNRGSDQPPYFSEPKPGDAPPPAPPGQVKDPQVPPGSHKAPGAPGKTTKTNWTSHSWQQPISDKVAQVPISQTLIVTIIKKPNTVPTRHVVAYRNGRQLSSTEAQELYKDFRKQRSHTLWIPKQQYIKQSSASGFVSMIKREWLATTFMMLI